MWNNTLSFLTLNTHSLTPSAFPLDSYSLLTCASLRVFDCASALSACGVGQRRTAAVLDGAQEMLRGARDIDDHGNMNERSVWRDVVVE